MTNMQLDAIAEELAQIARANGILAADKHFGEQCGAMARAGTPFTNGQALDIKDRYQQLLVRSAA